MVPGDLYFIICQNVQSGLTQEERMLGTLLGSMDITLLNKPCPRDNEKMACVPGDHKEHDDSLKSLCCTTLITLQFILQSGAVSGKAPP